MLHLIRERGLGDHIAVESAGTGAYHVGERPDRRSQATAQQRGIELPSRARKFEAEDFRRFDYVLAMDRDNYADLSQLVPEGERDKLHLLRSFDPASPARAEVPDPYFGGGNGFELVLDLCYAACTGLLEFIVERHGLPRSPSR